MGVYAAGAPITLGARVNNTELKPNTEYIFEYGVPRIAFSLMSPESIANLAQNWVRIKQHLGPAEEGQLFEVTGAKVETSETGEGKVWVRGRVSGPPEVLAAGVNPLYVLAAIGFILGVIGVGVTHYHTYSVGWSSGYAAAGGDPNTKPNPCTVKDSWSASLQCFLNRTGWVAVGVGVGALFTFVVLLVLIGRQK
jgi:hypothetical protein